jgi:hypothetical protein
VGAWKAFPEVRNLNSVYKSSIIHVVFFIEFLARIELLELKSLGSYP